MNSILYLVLKRMRRPLTVLLCIYSISILGFTFIPGVDDEGNVWKMDFFHAIYFVSFMGSTIGFGEIPYPFSIEQRLWTLVTIYTAVTGWLYTIGSLLSLIQDPILKMALNKRNFEGTVNRISEPFYIVCGYGDTGVQVIEALSNLGIRSVAIDSDKMKISQLEIQDFNVYVPSICADASDSDVLVAAGIKHNFCRGILILTDNDLVNLKVAITAKLLNPQIISVSRAEDQHIIDNMRSFGTDHVINPFDSFATLLQSAIKCPSQYLLRIWLTSSPGSPLVEPVFPPKEGNWVICGYGRFGHATHRELTNLGIKVMVVDGNPNETNPPMNYVFGAGTEAHTLREAGIDTAVAIIASNDDDANNLSTTMTARSLNDNLFIIARQNQATNELLFQSANLDMINHHSQIVARRTLAIITTPLTEAFLQQTRNQDCTWNNQLIARVSAITEDNKVPHTWVVHVKREGANAIWKAINNNRSVFIRHLCKNPSERSDLLDVVALMIKRDDKYILVPDDKELVRKGDQILFCGTREAEIKMRRISRNEEDLFYVRTGIIRPSGYFWRKFNQEKSKL